MNMKWVQFEAVRNQRGMSFVGILAALLIAAALYFGYFQMSGTTNERSKGIAALDATRDVACRTQRQQIERDITMWKVNHPDDEPSLAALRADGIRIPACPQGGQYDLVRGQVHCSVHG